MSQTDGNLQCIIHFVLLAETLRSGCMDNCSFVNFPSCVGINSHISHFILKPSCPMECNYALLNATDLVFSFSVADEFKAFYSRLPQNYFLNVSAIQHLWSLDSLFQWRYEQLENSMRVLSRRAQRVIFKLFSLSKRCHRQPQVRLPRER